MKNFIYFIAFISLLSFLTSCTAEEIEPVKKPQTELTAKDGEEIVPPIIIKP
jgi:hypothetical protein